MKLIRDLASVACSPATHIASSSMVLLAMIFLVAAMTRISSIAAETLIFCSRYKPHCNQTTKDGTFKSPEYPYTFQSKVDSRTYRFEGDHNERVQIIFDEFKLYRPEPNEVCGKRNSYLYYKTSNSTVYLCQRPLPILSSSSMLMLEYKQPPRNLFASDEHIMEEMKGFNATYRFVTNYGIDSGIQTSDECEFLYDSAYSINGTFQSPNYNGYYPGDMECIYYFKGMEKYLKINFTEFNLLGSSRYHSCSEVWKEDYVELTETADRDPNFFYQRACGQRDSFRITVNTSNFWVIFKSSLDHVNGAFAPERPFVGFRAFYEFTNDTSTAASVRPTLQGFYPPFSLAYLHLVMSFLLAAFTT